MKTPKPSIVVLPLVFLLISLSFRFTIFYSLENDVSGMNTNTDSDLSVEIHKPGAHFGDEQTLFWSPNNITEFREMQITVHAENINLENGLDMLNLKWTIHTDNLDITYFEYNTTDYMTNSTNNGIIITTLFTYDEEIWSGNYTLFVRLNLSDGTSLEGSSNQVHFKEQDFLITMNGNSVDNFVCTCSQTKFNLSILNSGSSESFFSLSVGLSYVEYKPFSIELFDANDGEDEITEDIIELSGGESYSVIINFVPNNDLLPNRSYTIRPLNINIDFQADGDEEVELYDGVPSFRLFSLPKYSYPEATVQLNDFNYERKFQTNSYDTDYNETLYTLGVEFLLLEYEILNGGYSSSNLNLNSSIESSKIRILYDGSNLTLTEFNDMNNIIPQKENITFQVFLEIDPELENTLFELEIKFAAAYITNTAIRLSSSPLGGNDIISSESNSVVFESIDEVRMVQIKIDTAFLDNLSYFENKWSLLCSNVDGFTIAIIGLQYPCDGGMTSLPISVNSTYDIEISVENWKPTQLIEIQITLYHNPSLTQSNLSQSVSISVKLEMPEDNESSNNETEDNNPIIDDDNRSLDVDNDGILDSQDSCLDTKPNVIVDDFGCEIVVQDTNGDTENNDDVAVKSDENDFLSYALFSVIAIIAIVMLQFYRLKKPKHEQNPTFSVNENTGTPLISTPYQALEPVVLQQWTDANGYSWRQMSDQTIMLWNGTDWIPYGKN